jgi:predicted SnoaL-like aldol condensation-catalyzing enzyme
MVSHAKPTDIINRLYDEFLKGNSEVVYDLADSAYHSHTEKSEVDPETLKLSCERMMAAMKDLRREILFEFNERDVGSVVHRYYWTDEETGEPKSLRSSDTYRLRDGKLLEHWGVLQFEDELELST